MIDEWLWQNWSTLHSLSAESLLPPRKEPGPNPERTSKEKRIFHRVREVLLGVSPL